MNDIDNGILLTESEIERRRSVLCCRIAGLHGNLMFKAPIYLQHIQSFSMNENEEIKKHSPKGEQE